MECSFLENNDYFLNFRKLSYVLRADTLIRPYRKTPLPPKGEWNNRCAVSTGYFIVILPSRDFSPIDDTHALHVRHRV